MQSEMFLSFIAVLTRENRKSSERISDNVGAFYWNEMNNESREELVEVECNDKQRLQVIKDPAFQLLLSS